LYHGQKEVLSVINKRNASISALHHVLSVPAAIFFFLLDIAAVFFVAFLFFVATAFPFFVEVVSGAGLAMGLLLMMKSGSGNGPYCLDSMLG
jgi:hypothetical protein